MAELNLKQITDKLNEEFDTETRKLIFWYDDNAEFSEEILNLELDKAKVYMLQKDNQLYTKYFLEKVDAQTSYLIYAPFPKPDIRENHLADTIEYSKQFFVDRASLICADLSIADEYKSVIVKYVRFFAAQERTKRFYDLDIEHYDRTAIEVGLISSVCKCKVASFEECMRIILTDSLEENKYLSEIEKYDLSEAFWNHVDILFGFSDCQPTLEKLLMTMFITYASQSIHGDIPSSWKPFVSMKTGSVISFLDIYMNSSVYGERFDELSSIIYKSVDGESVLKKLSAEALTDCFIFRGVDEILLSWLITRLENEDTAAKLGERSIPELCLLRRKQHYGNTFRNDYFVIENAYYIIKDSKYTPVSDINDIVKSYMSEWYKIDMRYRYFYFYYDKLDSNDSFEKLRTLIENIYTNEYLNKISANWCTSFAETEGKTSLISQKNFFDRYIRNTKDRVCVIISDAFRFEVAQTLFEHLMSDEKCTASIEAMQSVLPSVTQTGMTALLPHSSYTLNDNYKAEADGKICDDTAGREALLKTYSRNSRCVQYDELTKMDISHLREVFTNQDFVYVYHNQIDARGDKANTENEVFIACEEAVEEISKLIRRLTTSANTSHFFVTSDHGFLYKRDKIYESDKVSGVSKMSEVSGKRYAVSGAPLNVEGIRSVPMNKTFDNCSKFVSSPVGTDVIKAPGSGLNFVHGGCSPQEMIVPVIEVKTERSYTETRKATITLAAPLKTITNLILTLEFIQTEPVTDIVKEATYKVFFTDENNEIISNENYIIADRTDTETSHRFFKNRFNFKNTTYNKINKYYLVAVDDSNGIEVMRTEAVIDIAFAGSFGF